MGPAFRLVTTVIHPRPMVAETLTLTAAAGLWQRLPLSADSGRGFVLSVSEPRGAPLLAFLHEPGGMPFRGGAAQMVTDPDSAAVFRVDGRDAVGGTYELVVMAGPVAPVAARVRVVPAPARVGLTRAGDTVTVAVAGGGADSVTLAVIGAERGIRVPSRGSAERRVRFTLPGWARRVEIDMQLDPGFWRQVTDFGLTLLDDDGRFLATAPQNYAFGRLEADLPAGRPDRQAEIVLGPGFADPAAEPLWDATLTVRLYADSLGGHGGVRAARLTSSADGYRFRLPPLPWALGDAFFPLGRVTLHAGGDLWEREGRLAPPLPPIMP
jgi:hypothetical protein